MNILIVEDEHKLGSLIQRALSEKGYATTFIEDGQKAWGHLESHDYDLILLDIMLPGKDGIAICQELRKAHRTEGIIMITAKDTEEDIIKGLDAGADDYVVKPFSVSELLARVRTVLRRQEKPKYESLTISDLALDLLTKTAIRSGKKISLTNKEFRIIYYLINHQDRIVTRQMLKEHIWGYYFSGKSNVIDVYINRLRNKIDNKFDKKLIQTVKGGGYILKG